MLFVVVRAVYPTAKCRLRLLKLERIKDFLLLEKEYIRNQEVFKVRKTKEACLHSPERDCEGFLPEARSG